VNKSEVVSRAKFLQIKVLEEQVSGRFFAILTFGDPDVTGSVAERKFHHNFNQHGVVCKETEDNQGVVHKDTQWLDVGAK
jgi:hypothetical protein